MDEKEIRPGSLVLYKRRPARVVRSDDRLHIELDGGNMAKVRSKDVDLLHPGPVDDLDQLAPPSGEVALAWEILSEVSTDSLNLEELAGLIYGEYTPATAWAAWRCVEDGLYFHGQPSAIIARTPEEVRIEKEDRKKQAAEKEAWSAFLDRAQRGEVAPEDDAQFLRETEDLALGRVKGSRLLRGLGIAERPENAHMLLLKFGYWDITVDPYPVRLGLPGAPPKISLPAIPDERRVDLTGMDAFAIDDRDNKDPDDAISLESLREDGEGRFLGGSVWVHVADVAALISPGCAADIEARARGATAYFPEGAVPMLPQSTIQDLGLGLNTISPALSIRIGLNAEAEIIDVEVVPSQVKVQRLSYEAAEMRLEETPFADLYRLAQAYQARRQAHGALSIDLPEAIIQVADGKVSVRRLLRLRSRNLVREAMLMAGEAAAIYAIENGIPFPFVSQDPPDMSVLPEGTHLPDLTQEIGDDGGDLAAYYAMRRALKRSQVSIEAAFHSGIGLRVYSRVTSPLRRYLDLVAHQQLRAHFHGKELLSDHELVERIGASEAATESVNQAEALARRHWTLVYLIQNPGWTGEGMLVQKFVGRGRLIIPELALEAPVHLRGNFEVNSVLNLSLQGVNLPELEVFVEIESSKVD